MQDWDKLNNCNSYIVCKYFRGLNNFNLLQTIGLISFSCFSKCSNSNLIWKYSHSLSIKMFYLHFQFSCQMKYLRCLSIIMLYNKYIIRSFTIYDNEYLVPIRTTAQDRQWSVCCPQSNWDSSGSRDAPIEYRTLHHDQYNLHNIWKILIISGNVY